MINRSLPTFLTPHRTGRFKHLQNTIDKYKGQYDDGYDALAEKRLISLEQIGLIEPDHIASEQAYPETESWNKSKRRTKTN